MSQKLVSMFAVGDILWAALEDGTVMHARASSLKWMVLTEDLTKWQRGEPVPETPAGVEFERIRANMKKIREAEAEGRCVFCSIKLALPNAQCYGEHGYGTHPSKL